MEKNEAIRALESMGNELDWDEVAEIYVEFVGSPYVDDDEEETMTEFQMFSELCAEFGIME